MKTNEWDYEKGKKSIPVARDLQLSAKSVVSGQDRSWGIELAKALGANE